MDPVDTRDHRPGCSSADPEPTARQIGGGSYIMPIQKYNMRYGPALPSEYQKALR